MLHSKEWFLMQKERGVTPSQAAKALNVGIGKIQYWEVKHGVQLGRCSQLRTLDTTFFSVIDTEAKAYILGFVMADGCVNGRSLEIRVLRRDVDILYKIKRAMNAHTEVHQSDTTELASLYIGSIELLGSLAKFGVVKAKTSTIAFPILPDDLYRHFLRGYLDGDGWITERQYGIVTGSKDFYEGFVSYIALRYGLRPWIKDRSTNYDLAFGRKNKSVIQDIYHDATIYLDRKHQKFLLYWQHTK